MSRCAPTTVHALSIYSMQRGWASHQVHLNKVKRILDGQEVSNVYVKVDEHQWRISATASYSLLRLVKGAGFQYQRKDPLVLEDLLATLAFIVFCSEKKLFGVEEIFPPSVYRKDLDDIDFHCMSKEDELRLFPLKKFPQADLRVNMFLRDVLRFTPVPRISLNAILAEGMSNDQACAAVLFSEYLMKSGFPLWVVEFFGNMFYKNQSTMKNMTIFLKSFGYLDDCNGFVFVENECLMGRGLMGADPMEDLCHRICDNENPKEFVPDYDRLRRIIKGIYAREIAFRPLDIPDLEDHIGSSPVWCKKGAHHHPFFKHYPDRFEFVSSVGSKRILKVPPCVFINQARKLENGKTRYIYNCDTISYLRFDYLLHPIESMWCNHNCILNSDVKNAAWLSKQKYDVYSALDFEDFNSQHSIQSQKIVFEELAPFLPQRAIDNLRWCVDSFDHMQCSGEHWSSTMPSGHRGTNFINTVLNRAYVEYFFGEINGIHCGDDVLILGRLITEEELDNAKFKLQKKKQSFGGVSEWLRVKKEKSRSYGYIARSLSSLVSGNWLSDCFRDSTATLPSLLNLINTCSLRCLRKPYVPLGTYGVIMRRYVMDVDFYSELFQGNVYGSGIVCYGQPKVEVNWSGLHNATGKVFNSQSKIITQIQKAFKNYTGTEISKHAVIQHLESRTRYVQKNVIKYHSRYNALIVSQKGIDLELLHSRQNTDYHSRIDINLFGQEVAPLTFCFSSNTLSPTFALRASRFAQNCRIVTNGYIHV